MGFTKKKMINVGVAVTTENKMEVAVVDKETNTVVEYRTYPVDYNFQTKEISDYGAFASALRTVLFDEIGLNPKNIELTLTIPNIHFSTLQIPSTVEGSGMNSVCVQAAMDSYLFKRHEPVAAVHPYPAPGKEEYPVVYAAIQQSVASQLSDIIINEIGVENFSICNPYASIINALSALGKIDRQINSNERWNFVQITNSGFTLFSMEGTRIIEINDMPLPLKTFAPEEIYESMALSLQNNLSIYPASSLFVLSRTDLLSAQLLLQRMDLRGDIQFLENNRYAIEPFVGIGENVDSDLSKIISVEVVGSAITDKNSPLNLCYYTNKDLSEVVYGYIKLFGQDIPVNNTFIVRCIIGTIICLICLFTLLYLIFGGINKILESKIDTYQKEKAELDSKIAKARGETGGSVDNIIADISKNNKASVAFFNSISTEIPNDVWLTYYYSDSSGALAIKGDTSDVGSIYEFFKGVKGSVEQSGITLSKLEYNDIDALLVPGGQGNKSMNFEITNSAYSNKTKMMASQIDNKEGGENVEQAGEGTNTNQSTSSSSSDNKSSGDDEFDESGFPQLPESGLKPPTQ